ncbi:hypothetical protein [Marinicauda algicola]|uniref:GHMP family kinase ATP-binding protein n=1 Tax=Marinicauda algicola TaxID=2029849 RepID=UPI0019D1D377|nr:hypothetical protein [Marinicauda algicola]
MSPYCDEFGGLVLNAAINRFCHVTIEPRQDGLLLLHSADMGNRWEGAAPEFLGPESGAPTLMRGVYNRIVKDYRDGEPMALSITSYADAPAGSGLGTSSSMVIALLAAFSELLSLPLGPYDLARLAYEIERVDLGLSGGRQDQYAAAFGGFNYMEFYAGEHTLVNQLRLRRRTVLELESSLVIYFTGVSRESARIIEQQKDSVKSHGGQRFEAMHRLKDGAIRMKEALLLGRISELARLLDESWQHKKQTSDKISTGHIDEIYEAAIKAGALGGKVSGAGGGGFMMFLVDPVCREAFIRVLSGYNGKAELCNFWPEGAESWTIG